MGKIYLCPTCHSIRWTGHAELVSPTSLGDVFQLAKPVEGVRKEDGERKGREGRAKRNEGRLVNCPETRQIFHPTAEAGTDPIIAAISGRSHANR